MAKKLEIDCETECLFKNKDTTMQSKLNKEQRKENIKGVYLLKNEEKINNKNILLIDDIYTTGSTVNECIKTLKKAKIKNIDILTIAKD